MQGQTCINVVKWDGKGDLFPGAVLLPAGSPAGPGWTWDGRAWGAPPAVEPTPDPLLARLEAAEARAAAAETEARAARAEAAAAKKAAEDAAILKVGVKL